MSNEILSGTPTRPEIAKNGRVWLSVFLAVNLINLPNLLACLIPYFTWLSLELWIFSTALTLLACALGMRVRLMLWLAVPVILLVPSCLACLLSIQSLPTTFLILALLETNPTEIAAFQTPILLTGAGTLLLVTFYVWFVKTRIPADFRLSPVGRGLILVILLLPVCLNLLSRGQAAGLGGIKQRCLTTFPYATLYGVYEAFDMRARVQSRKDLVEKLDLKQEAEFSDETNRQVHMMVIGESATKSNFGLYGYERQTTPLLERTPGLLPFREVTSTATITLLAVPTLLTASPPGKVLEATSQASILSAYKKAGFHVYWLSTQKKHGTYDTLTSIFSADADESLFMSGKFDSQGVGSYMGASDASLLPLVRNILQRKESKVLFVLHTIGSHGPYPVRYEPEQARFPADKAATMHALMRIAGGAATNPQDLELAQNSYDNTICATDFLLANLINELKQTQASSWLCYIADHGENTSKARFGKFMHGMFTRQVIEVPMFMWLSPLYEQAHPGKADALKTHLNTPFSATCTFHTLLDMGGLSCPDFKKEWSCASPQFVPGKRIVCDPMGRIIDYDQRLPMLQAVNTAQSKLPLEKIQAIAEKAPSR
jgi:glucan phosphoethanolaminetransferase (alkaline phosphatase superfamily)